MTRGLSPAARNRAFLGIVLMGLALPGAATAAIWTVDCDTGGKIQTAVAGAVSGDTIRVRGVCNENVSVRDELARLTIDGQGLATLVGPDSAAAGFQVLGRNITIKGFTITGGRNAITVLRGGSALIDSNSIHDTGTGISVQQNGHARIVGNTIQLSVTGISVQEGSIARIGYLDVAGPVIPNVIRNNRGTGVIVQRGSTAALTGNTIDGNDGTGVLVTGGSHADIAGNTIDANGGDGVFVTINSDVQLGAQAGLLAPANETTAPNQGFGLRCSANSTPVGNLGTLAGLKGGSKLDASCSNGRKSLDDGGVH